MKIKLSRFSDLTVELTDEFIQRATTAMCFKPNGEFTNGELRKWLVENDNRLNDESAVSAADNIIKKLKKQKILKLGDNRKWKFTNLDRDHPTGRQQ
jgi:hypothetical protein